ncbi:MAG: TRAP transporter small permease subunit [Acidiferrobacterales bacterium]|nr:TRAP transporter small permease subunit [Acidiferrobacterales bacterium]
MNIDLIELWHSLDRLPFVFSITVYALVLTTVAAFLVIPVVLMFRSEPHQIIRSFQADREVAKSMDGYRSALQRTASCLTLFNTVIGRFVAWLVLFMTLMQFVVVIMRYVFTYGSIQMQESIWYMHGLLFMLGAGYTLAKEGHVRLDVFYREMTERTKAWINLVGSAILLLPFCIVNFDFAWSFVLNSWAVREGSAETAGLQYIYLFKTVILVFSVLLVIEGISLAVRSVLQLTAPPDKSSRHRALE